ncbi:MAG: hypothetical protein WBP81_24870 [Solirubrobacteraceae bacterium]
MDRDAVSEDARTATDGSFIPHQWTLSNYSDIFNAGISPVRCATRSGSL